MRVDQQGCVTEARNEITKTPLRVPVEPATS